MYGFINTQCLVLHCTDLEYFPDDIDQFIALCDQKGFISQEDRGLEKNYYLTGDRFLQLVTFMGCSPYLKIYPEHDEDTNYCSVYIPDAPQAVEFITSTQAKRPFCPDCRKALDINIKTLAADKRLVCPHCHKEFQANELDWRRNAGFINFAITISQVFPKEAIPTDKFLSWLATITKRKWKYFYTDFSV